MDFEQRYRPMETRDDSYAGEFFAAVTSTDIYCRPGCPARTPKRENLRICPERHGGPQRRLPRLPALSPR